MQEVWEWRLNNMGKVRAAVIGDEELEQKQKEEAEKRRLAKIEAAKAAGQAKKAAEAEHVISKESENSPEEVSTDSGDDKEQPKKKVVVKKESQRVAPRSSKYLTSAKLIDKSKQYPVKEALSLVEKAHIAKFDETVELHVNTLTTGVSGQVTLPHGTGKQTRVAILQPAKDPKAADDLLKQIEAGKIDFDVLVATPDAMPRLAKVARVLGPKGLMPNPKAGTVTPKPEEVAAKFAGGQMNFKTEAKAPIIHLSVGKLSFGADKLAENIHVALKAIKSENIKKVVVKSTMSPAVKLALGK